MNVLFIVLSSALNIFVTYKGPEGIPSVTYKKTYNDPSSKYLYYTSNNFIYRLDIAPMPPLAPEAIGGGAITGDIIQPVRGTDNKLYIIVVSHNGANNEIASYYLDETAPSPTLTVVTAPITTASFNVARIALSPTGSIFMNSYSE